MVLERVTQIASHLFGQIQPHPLDPLSPKEIEDAVAIINEQHSGLFYNAVFLWEPRKAEMLAWQADQQNAKRPHRVADVVAVGRGSKVYDGLVDLDKKEIIRWELTEGVQPLVKRAILTVVMRD